MRTKQKNVVDFPPSSGRGDPFFRPRNHNVFVYYNGLTMIKIEMATLYVAIRKLQRHWSAYFVLHARARSFCQLPLIAALYDDIGQKTNHGVAKSLLISIITKWIPNWTQWGCYPPSPPQPVVAPQRAPIESTIIILCVMYIKNAYKAFVYIANILNIFVPYYCIF